MVSYTELKPNKAVPLRHPIRWAVALFLALLTGAFLYDAAHRAAYDWKSFGHYLFDVRVFKAALVTLELTIASMVIAIILGITLAVM